MVNSINTIMYNLDMLNERNTKVNHGMSTGEALEYGSDDSLRYDFILGLKNDISVYESIEEGISYNSAFNSTSDSVLGEIKNITESIKVELIRANTDTINQDEKEIVATQIEYYKNTLFSLANSSVDGQYLFSGNNLNTQAFTMDESTNEVSYQSDNSVKNMLVDKNNYASQGANGIDIFYYEDRSIDQGDAFTFSSNEIVLDEAGNEWKLLDTDSDGIEDGLFLNADITSSSISVSQNLDGTFSATNTSSVTLDINHSYFDLLDEISNALKLQDSSGNAISEDAADLLLSSSIEKLDTAYDSQNNSHSLIGSRTSIIDNYSSSIQSKITNLSILEHEYGSADLTALAVEAQALENTYTALYSTINRVNNLSLVQYLN